MSGPLRELLVLGSAMLGFAQTKEKGFSTITAIVLSCLAMLVTILLLGYIDRPNDPPLLRRPSKNPDVANSPNV